MELRWLFCQHRVCVRFVDNVVWGWASFRRPTLGARCLRCSKVVWLGVIDEDCNFVKMEFSDERQEASQQTQTLAACRVQRETLATAGAAQQAEVQAAEAGARHSMTDIRLEVDRRMRQTEYFSSDNNQVRLVNADGVCVAMLEEQRAKWGHVAGCGCHKPGCCEGYHERVRDPRCTGKSR